MLPLMDSIVQSLMRVVLISLKQDTDLTQDTKNAIIYDEYYLAIAASLLDSSFVAPMEIKNNVNSVVEAIENEKDELHLLKELWTYQKRMGRNSKSGDIILRLLGYSDIFGV